MRIEFWFDPACPFCWTTSRMIERVRPHRDLEVTWRPISLLFKNETPPDSAHYARMARTRDLLRVVEATRAGGDENRIGDLYREFGRFIHHRGQLDFDVAVVLKDLNLDEGYAAALDDESWDEVIRASMEDGLELTGPDVGTPLIAFEGPNCRRGVFGPVISELPDLDEALALWDGVVSVATSPAFFELKRTRNGPPTIPPESALDE